MKNRIDQPAGQGLLELIFSIGVIILVLAGVVTLLTSSLRYRTAGFDRKKAAELGQKVMDLVIEEKVQDPTSFWDPVSNFWTTNVGPTMSGSSIGYSGYDYTISVRQETSVSGCGPSFDCIEVTIGVGWSSTNNQNLTFSRFFSK